MMLRTELMLRPWLSSSTPRNKLFQIIILLICFQSLLCRDFLLGGLEASVKNNSQKQILSSEAGKYLGKIKMFLLSESMPRSIQGLIFRFTDYLKFFAPSSWLLAVLLLISIASEGWTGNRKNQSSLLFINCLLTTTTTKLLWRKICIQQLLFDRFFLSIFSVCSVLNYNYMVEG